MKDKILLWLRIARANWRTTLSGLLVLAGAEVFGAQLVTLPPKLTQACEVAFKGGIVLGLVNAADQKRLADAEAELLKLKAALAPKQGGA